MSHLVRVHQFQPTSVFIITILPWPIFCHYNGTPEAPRLLLSDRACSANGFWKTRARQGIAHLLVNTSSSWRLWEDSWAPLAILPFRNSFCLCCSHSRLVPCNGLLFILSVLPPQLGTSSLKLRIRFHRRLDISVQSTETLAMAHFLYLPHTSHRTRGNNPG